MATRTWLDASTDANDTANWSGGSVPVSGDTVRILTGSKVVTTNVDWSAKNNLVIEVGSSWAGQFGSADTPFKTGTGTSLKFAGSSFAGYYHNAAGGTAYVHNASSATDKLILSGTWAAVYVTKAGHLNIGASATITALYVLTQSAAISVLGAVTTAYIQGGTITGYGAVTTLNLDGGTWYHKSGNIGTLTVTGSGGFWCQADAGITVTTLDVRSGTVDFSGAGPCVITNSTVSSLGTLNLVNRLNNITTTNPVSVLGGSFAAGAGATFTLVTDGRAD